MSKANILIVDDELGPREALRMILKDDFSLSFAKDGKEALEFLSKNIPDVIVMDIRMPRMDGIQTLQTIKKIQPDIEVLIVTGYASVDSAMKAIKFGAYDYISKPFDKDEILKAIQKGIEKRKKNLEEKRIIQEFHEIRQRLIRNYTSTITALIEAIDVKDSYTAGHSNRVSKLTGKIAEEMNLSRKEVDIIQHMALLHDIGKIGVHEDILRKEGQLEEHEWNEFKNHPINAIRILQHIDFLEGHLDAIRSHHERYDGLGYPDGLKGNEICLGARIISVADSWDAMQSNRPYRKSLEKEKAIEELIRNSGTQFDPEIVKVALKILL
jgi:putative two-component system response regulator